MTRKKSSSRFQKIRVIVLTLSTALFPVTFYYLSPAIPLGGAYQGIITGSLVVFAVLTIISMVLGRSFCSWICPAGGLQDQIGRGRTARVPVKRISWIKYAVWVVWLAGLLLLFQHAGGVKGIEFAFQTEMGMSTTSVQALMVYTIVIGIFMLLSLVFGRRTGCHTVCWISPFMIIGRKTGLVTPIPSLRLHSVPSTCVSCGQCTATCPMSLDVQALVQEGSITDNNCILCGRCIDTCGRNAISFGWKRAGGT